MPQDDANAELINAINFDDESDATDVKDEVDQLTTPEESSTEETKETDAEESTDTEETEDADTDEKSEESESEESEETKEDPKQKGKNNAQERIRSLANENRELKRQIEAATAQAYQPKSAEQLQEEGMDETSAQVEAMRQEQAIRDYNSHVVQLTSDLNMESLQVMHDMPIFDPGSPEKPNPEYNKEFADFVASKYNEYSGIQTDPKTGQIVQANVLPYDFYKSYAETFTKGRSTGEIKGKRNAIKQQAATDAPSQSATKRDEGDPLMKVLLAD